MEDSVREEGKSLKSSNQKKVIAEVDAVMISKVEKLESLLVDQNTKMYVKESKDEVKKIVEKLRDMKLEEKSKLKKLISYVVKEARRIIKVGDDIYSIWRDLKAINERIRQLLQNDGVGEGVRDRDGDVVGLEDDVELLLRETKFITSIVGFDGFGKTALARHLYNHADVVKNFKCRAWVNCMDFLDRKELLISIIQQVAPSLPKDLEKMEEQVQNMLWQQLVDNSYFIVLDNIWTPSCYPFSSL